MWFANNSGADQPAHLRRLISAFVIRLFETIIPRLASSAISIFWLVSVAEEAGLNLTCRKPLRQVFSRRGPNIGSSKKTIPDCPEMKKVKQIKSPSLNHEGM